jgi:hypothetical protein
VIEQVWATLSYTYELLHTDPYFRSWNSVISDILPPLSISASSLV